jgi:hypothetical protein
MLNIISLKKNRIMDPEMIQFNGNVEQSDDIKPMKNGTYPGCS